jgi:Na+/H+-translocating membrane pyrophosphatase
MTDGKIRGVYAVLGMAVISLKLTEALDAQLTEQAHRRRLSKSELVRRALTAFLQSSELDVEGGSSHSAADLLADLVGCCEGGPADLSSNPTYLSDFGAI